ncbi:MAG TPA: Crp/Fnr family transcriptional regulator [Burkholderiales bacterium]|nr:Crp/Fnr family transcriptional regulator [Burkholderiales bacterium]
MAVRPTPASPSPRQNHLLAALHAAEYERLLPDLEPVPMPLGSVLYESGGRLEHIYFPTTSVVSLLYVMKDGDSAEIAIAGNEGLVGIALITGGQTTPSRAVVQCGGQAYRVKPGPLKLEFDRGEAMQRLMLRYLQALVTQMVQTAACNRHHSVEQQFCRWLLLSIDRLPTNELTMTEGLIANMLGLRQDGVLGIAQQLESEGLIHYEGGRITVLDRPGVEARACECYSVVKKEFDRLLPDQMMA